MHDQASIATDGPEWRIEEGLTPYPEALALMRDRVAAIRAATAGELVWLVEHPPLYTAGTSGVWPARARPPPRPRAGDSAARSRPPAALHRRHLRQTGGIGRPLPVPQLCSRPRRSMDLSWPRSAHRLCDARPHASAWRRADQRHPLLRQCP